VPRREAKRVSAYSGRTMRVDPEVRRKVSEKEEKEQVKRRLGVREKEETRTNRPRYKNN